MLLGHVNARAHVVSATLPVLLLVLAFATQAAAQSAAFTARDFPLPGNNFVAADFNGDGRPDIAGAGQDVTVMLGNGDGTFAAGVVYAAGGSLQDIAAADLNGDGRLDLVVTINSSQFSLGVLLGNGDGTFGPPAFYPNVTGLESPSLVVADFNHDSRLDLAIAHPSGCYTGSCVSGRSVSVMLGNGDGTFQPAQQIDVGPGPVKIAVGDFNRDGNGDLAVAASAANVFVLLGRGDGTFLQQPNLVLSTDALADNTDIDVADFNRDGIQDLAVASPFSQSTKILLGVGDGTFRAPATITNADGQYPQYQAVADFNGDGKLDIAVGLGYCCTTSADGFMDILNGNGDGTFQAPVHYLAPHAVTSNTGGVLIAKDFNGDGRPDIALQITGASGRLTVLTNTTGSAPVPLAYGGITASPASVVGGGSTQITVTLAPGAVAPAGGLPLSVSSSASSVSVPSGVTMAGGASSVTFTATTRSVTASQTATVKVSNNQLGSTSTNVTVTPPATTLTVSGLTLSPGTVTGGTASRGTVTLSAAAQASTVVTLSSSSASAAVPASVTVPAGSSSASFTISTSSVASPTSATISATLGGVTRSAVLTINPAGTTTTADTVAVTLAQYDTAKRVLRLEATSTSATATMQAFVTSTGQLLGTLANNGGGKYTAQFNVATNPQNVTVRSSLGGSASAAVVAK